MSSTEKDEDVTGIDNKIRYQPFSYLGFFFSGGGYYSSKKATKYKPPDIQLIKVRKIA
jgi:hypothetical protein